MLLEKGAEINAQTKYGHTPLHLAAQDGHTGAVRVLLEKGANIDAETNSGLSALQIALDRKYPEVADLLEVYQPSSSPRV